MLWQLRLQYQTFRHPVHNESFWVGASSTPQLAQLLASALPLPLSMPLPLSTEVTFFLAPFLTG
eukprot:CAMPEP_0119514684 /NCGR_PEP_ID=MMETSP1344-20130328/32433_1 /TAXON_ID=236787 /ORGANISM="Florenciella parvula, Strain CCMP2471" /LENGTH=63 /DNA_ID=CAMNT_0007552023 /DNA_START=175 /DNA_END=363 /DNA_ORIENTATION=+